MPAPKSSPQRRMKAPERCRAIVAVAARVFAERGYEAASLVEIAAAAGISRAVLYDHFDSKATLFLAVMEAKRRALAAHVGSELADDGPLDERLAAAFDTFFALLAEDPHTWRLLFRDEVSSPEVAEAQRRLREEVHLMVIGAFLERFAAPDPASDPNERAMFAAAWGAAMNGLARWWFDHRDVPRAVLVEAAMNALWCGAERLAEGRRWRAG